MALFHRLFCVGCLAVILAPYSLAQTLSTAAASSSEKTIESWLLSEDPRLVAWGAHGALLSRDRHLVPDLLSLASRWQPLSRQATDYPKRSALSPEQVDKRDAMAAVLDALIQMKVPVPVDTLSSLAPDFGNAVAVLLSRMPPEEAQSVSFDFYRIPSEHSYGLQYVSAALLALRPVPGFAADLLSNISVHVNVFAVSPGSGQFVAGTSDGSCAVASDVPRKDWPVIGQYAFSRQKSDGAMLLVAGIDPIYATRTQSTNYLSDSCGMSWGTYLGPEQRRRLIAEMLDISPEAIPWQTGLTTTITFQSPDQFDRAVLAFVEEQQQKYRATAAALADRGFLTSSEAEESLPTLNLKLNDMRGEGATPIPDPSNLPSHVEWSSSPFF